MAAVKTIMGKIVDAGGTPLVTKTVTLLNDATGAPITTTTTDANGLWEFANRDETLRYRASAAFGGSSSQVVVRAPASAEFDHLYANSSVRTAAAAVVAFGGAVSTGALTVGGNVGVTGTLTVSSTTTLGGNLGVAGSATVVGILTAAGANITGQVVQSGGYAYLGAYNTAGTNYPRAGSDVAVGWNWTAGGRDITAFNTDLTATTAFTWRQLTGASASTDLLRLLSSGQVAAPDGTLAAPGLTSINDPDTGLYRLGANNIAVSLGGVKTIDLGGATASTAFTTTATGKIPVRISGFAAQTADMLQIRNSANTLLFAVEASGQCDILGPANLSGNIGFFGTAPVAGPRTVTGSRGGNAALASVLNELQTLGLIINSTS